MFAILFEVLLIEIQEEIHHFAAWEGGGLRGTKIVNKHFVNKLAFPNLVARLRRCPVSVTFSVHLAAKGVWQRRDEESDRAQQIKDHPHLQ